MILPDDLALKRVVKYGRNTLAAFVNSPQAAHGVSPRGPSELPRRYINFIVETPFKAFDVPEIGLAERSSIGRRCASSASAASATTSTRLPRATRPRRG